MIPDNQLSSEPMPTEFLLLRRRNPLVDYEWGGVALNNPSHGLNIAVWQIIYDEEILKICVKRTDSEQIFPLIDAENISRIGLAFDQSMRPQLCYVENEVTKLYWFDTSNAEMVTTIFEGVRNPCISLDDTRLRQTNTSDVIFAYQKGGQLCYRQQRDRYEIEYVLADNVQGVLWQIGMSRGNRFQFAMRSVD